jgi:Ca2+-binding RTX toxin-like protein
VTFRLGTGDDQLQSSAIALALYAAGDSGTDVLFGSYAGDVLSGGLGNDTTHGAGGDDRLVDAADIFGATTTEGGADTMLGEGGDDTLVAGSGADTMDGGAGTDTADYSARTAPVTVTVDAGSGNDGAAGEGDDVLGVERLLGGAGADALTAGAAPGTLAGAAGDDTLVGGAAADLLSGGDLAGSAGSGDDTLDGRGGPDELRGGDGSDTVSYATRTAAVTVSPDDVADDGQAGEQDNVRSDVESLLGGTGDDSFRLRDDRRETVACGPGTDTVLADAADVVAADCEQVDRPAVAAPGTGGTTTTILTPPVTPATPPPPAGLSLPAGVVRADAKGRLVLRLRCSAGTGGCAGRLTLRKGPRTVARATYLLATAKTGSLTLVLPRALRRAGAHLTLRAAPVIGTAPRAAATLTLRAPVGRASR